MSDCGTRSELLALDQRLMEIRDMVGWLCTNHRFAVNYRGNQEATKRVQAQLEAASEFIHVIYIYSILDEAGFRPSNKWISTDDKNEFKAWVHIRHTGAHTPAGRANVYYRDFDSFMTSDQSSKSRLKPNCTWNADTISLPYASSYDFFQFARQLVQDAIGYCANNNQPP